MTNPAGWATVEKKKRKKMSMNFLSQKLPPLHILVTIK